jgi:tetratricopeptide (TPR) repeat protein
MQLEVLLLRCELYLNEKNLEACRATMKEVEGLFPSIRTKPVGIMINLIQGRYHTETKEFQEAERSLKQALALCNELGEKPSTGKVYYFLARMESARGEKKYSRECLGKALEIFVSVRARGWQERVQKALKEQTPL